MVRKSSPKQTLNNTTTNNGDKPIRGRKAKADHVSNDVCEKEINSKPQLTKKQECFIREYLIDLNATQAAIRAGYSSKTAQPIAAQLLLNVIVVEAIKKALEERAKETKIDADYVLYRLKEIDEMDALDILEDDGNVRPIREWPKIWRQFISGFEVVEMMNGKGDDKYVAGMLKKIKWPDKTKNLELIGKHVNVGAFRERVEHSGVGGGPIQQEMKITSVDPIEASKQYQSLIEGI